MKSIYVCAIWLLLMLMCGCSKEILQQQLSSVQAAYSDGLDAFDAKDFEQAESKFNEALRQGGLTVDMMCDARLKRAKSRIELSDFDGAQDDLEFLMEGSPEIVDVLATSGDLALKRGEIPEAKQYYVEARKINSKLPLPPELQ